MCDSELSSVESVWQMFNDEFLTPENDRDNIETSRKIIVFGVGLQIESRGFQHFLLFSPGNAVFCLTKGRSAGFDLDKYDGVLLPGNDVYLSVQRAIVADYDLITVCLQEADSQFFAMFSQRLVFIFKHVWKKNLT